MIDSRVHDQAFVKLAMIEMIQSIDVPDDAVIAIESENCSGQYKSSHHFTTCNILQTSLTIQWSVYLAWQVMVKSW